MDTVNAFETEGFEIARFKDVQHFQQVYAARTGWRERNDLITTIIGRNRFAQYGSVICEVARGHDAAVLLHPGFGCFGKWAAVEPFHAVFGDQAKGVREVRLAEEIAALVDSADRFPK